MADAEPQDAYMYFEPTGPVKGSVTEEVYKGKNAFQLTNFTVKGTNATNVGSATGGGGGAGKVKMERLECEKFTDASTVGLVKAMIKGHHFDKAIIELRSNGVVYLSYTFYMVLVSEASTNQAGDDEGKDTLVFDWGAMEVKYFGQNEKGERKQTDSAMFSRVKGNESLDVKAAN